MLAVLGRRVLFFVTVMFAVGMLPTAAEQESAPLTVQNPSSKHQTTIPNTPEKATMSQEERVSNRIDYIEIPVADVQAAKKFYGDIFGWTYTDYGPDYASFNDGRLDGGLAKGTGGSGGPLVIFYDAMLEEKEAKIRKSNGKITKEIFAFPGGRRFHFQDPDGNEFAVWSDK